MKQKPLVLITVHGGCVDWQSQGDVDVEQVDFDVFDGGVEDGELPEMSVWAREAFPETAKELAGEVAKYEAWRAEQAERERKDELHARISKLMGLVDEERLLAMLEQAVPRRGVESMEDHELTARKLRDARLVDDSLHRRIQAAARAICESSLGDEAGEITYMGWSATGTSKWVGPNGIVTVYDDGAIEVRRG